MKEMNTYIVLHINLLHMSGNKMLNDFCKGLRFILTWVVVPIIIMLVILGLLDILIDFLFWQGYE